jgi:hypothetical protein
MGKTTSYQDPMELPTFISNKKQMSKNRSVITQAIRDRKIATRKGWEALANRYLAVKHKWLAHIFLKVSCSIIAP